MPFLTVLRPCGNGINPLDQVIAGDGKPKARQETEAMVFPVTFITLLGISMNCGGTNKIRKRNKTSTIIGPYSLRYPKYTRSQPKIKKMYTIRHGSLQC